MQPDVHPEMFEALCPGDKTSRLILWPRGHFKTTAVVVDVVQRILNDADCRIMLMQASLKLTRGWLAEIFSHFSGKNPKSKLLQLFPEFAATGNADGFTVACRKRVHLKEKTVVAASPKAVATGQHYSALYADDLVHTGNFRNVELLDKLENEFSHFIPLIDPGGYITVTGTRYSFADIYQRIITRNKGEWVVSVKGCFRDDGGLLFPERVLTDGRKIGFTPELLAQIQRDDPETFSAQYLNQVISAKNHIFPEPLIFSVVRASSDKEFPALSPCVFMIDLAESTKAESDNSVISIGRQDGRGRVWVSDVIGDTWSPANLAIVILQQTLKHRPARILIEKQPGAEFFGEYLKTMGLEKGLRLPIDYVKRSNQKNAKYLRIASLESAFRDKRMVLLAGINNFDRLVQEFTEFPRGRHDDRPDCLALLYKFFSEQQAFQKLAPTETIMSHISREERWAAEALKEREMSSDMLGYGFTC